MLAADDLAVVAAPVGRRAPADDVPSPSRRGGDGRRAQRCSTPRGRSSPPSAIFVFAWQCVVWSGWKPEYVLPGPRRRRRLAVGHHRRRARAPGRGDHVPAGDRRLRRVDRHRCRHRPRRVQLEDRAPGDRLDDHRHPDDAVDRLVPAGHRAVPARRGGDPLRRHPRRRPGDRQRADHRHRPRPSAAAPRRAGDRRPRRRAPTATSSCRRRCRRSSAGSSRAGRSPGAA